MGRGLIGVNVRKEGDVSGPTPRSEVVYALHAVEPGMLASGL